MIVLLDSTALIDALRKKRSCTLMLEEMMLAGHTLATSVINVAEVFAGMRSAEQKETLHFMSALDVYPVTFSIARRAGEIKNEAASQGLTVALDDMLVAATALEHGCRLMTENRKDFRKSGVVFYERAEN